jgi:hypothetical protein
MPAALAERVAGWGVDLLNLRRDAHHLLQHRFRRNLFKK